jgi:hypothetical protein
MSESLTQSCAPKRSDDELEASIRIVEVTEDGTWRVRLPGSRRASAIMDSRGAAEARAREILRRCGGGEIRVYDTAGEPFTYSVAPQVELPGRRQLTRQPRS